MKARNRPHLITVEARSVTKDTYGGEKETWAEYCRAYASIFYGTGKEQREAAQVGGSQPASFDVPNDSLIRAISIVDHRISFGGSIWNITAMHDLGLNDGVRITAIKAAA